MPIDREIPFLCSYLWKVIAWPVSLIYLQSHNSLYIFGVIPAKAGIQFDREMDARLRTSGMTGKGKKP